MRTQKPRASCNERCTRKVETLPNSEPPLIATRKAFFTKIPVALGGGLAVPASHRPAAPTQQRGRTQLPTGDSSTKTSVQGIGIDSTEAVLVSRVHLVLQIPKIRGIATFIINN